MSGVSGGVWGVSEGCLGGQVLFGWCVVVSGCCLGVTGGVWYIPPTQARDSQTLPRVVTRAQPEGQPEVKSDCPELGLEV